MHMTLNQTNSQISKKQPLFSITKSLHTALSGINEIVDAEMEGLIADLKTLIRQPSISAKKQGLVECANLVAKIMRKAGINSEVLYLDDKSIPPIVYGELKSKSNPNKTILFTTTTMCSQKNHLSYGRMTHLVERSRVTMCLAEAQLTIREN